MSRCYYLDYISNSLWGNSKDIYICKLSGKQMYSDSEEIKYKCNSDFDDEYKKCPVFRERR